MSVCQVVGGNVVGGAAAGAKHDTVSGDSGTGMQGWGSSHRRSEKMPRIYRGHFLGRWKLLAQEGWRRGK